MSLSICEHTDTIKKIKPQKVGLVSKSVNIYLCSDFEKITVSNCFTIKSFSTESVSVGIRIDRGDCVSCI